MTHKEKNRKMIDTSLRKEKNRKMIDTSLRKDGKMGPRMRI